MISVQETLETLYINPAQERKRMDKLRSEEESRPDWDSWFMTLCFVVAQRSLDKTTKHGCVVVDESRSILSVGYNSPPRGCVDSMIPLERPAKYDYMQHSEANAITNAARCGTKLLGSTFYITGPPCTMCFGKIINVGARKVVYGPILHQRTEEQIKAIKIMQITQDVEMIELKNVSSVFCLLSKTERYISAKIGDNCE